MKKNKALPGILALAATTMAIAYLFRRIRIRRQRQQEVVANAGYELAYDVHYPLKHNRRRSAAGEQNPDLN